MIKKLKIIISGGGTGGHIFPAISIANELKEMVPECEILFVGAQGRMEMERVPAAGYSIVGLPIMGFPRKPGLKMVTFFVHLVRSMRSARREVKHFKPDVVVGVGGYASGPVLRVASKLKIPTLIQEQNSYAGLTNRLLARKVNTICVAYDNMDKYFSASKIVYTGNPVRKTLIQGKSEHEKAFSFFKLEKDKKVLLIIGGSLGARTLNESVLKQIDSIEKSNVQVIWQTGQYYYQSMVVKTKSKQLKNIQIHQFISRMDWAYAVADLVISRAGAGTISELSLMQKPTILVPSPNVAEDHQTKNALALVKTHAAVMIPDSESLERLIPEAINLINNPSDLDQLAFHIGQLAKPNAASDIAKLVLELAKK
jgi:UDP-N-acetylglucosamine--N-acetylmuramyl-(pentapeptide) pyrophosphoryl-undecaprenol N-acetylglucosamine transferase